MFRLIFLDYSMPDIDGPDVARLIRASLKEQQIEQPLICCCSAYSDDSFIKKAYDAGMDKYLIKPVSAEDIHNLTIVLYPLI